MIRTFPASSLAPLAATAARARGDAGSPSAGFVVRHSAEAAPQTV